MRIVHAVRSDGFAGVERHVALLARAQAAAGHQVAVVGGRPDAMGDALAGAPVRQRSASTTLEVARALRRLSSGSDVVHVHMTAAEVGATISGVGHGPGRPVVVTTRHFAGRRGHGLLGPLVSAVARRDVTAQIAISRFVAEHVDGESVVVHPGVARREPLAPAADRDRVVLLAQRLEPEKRTDLGLRAFAASRLAADGWRLDVVGDGSLRAETERLATSLGLDGAVRFRGHRADVHLLMAHAAILLAPCPVEGLGLSVLEAMAAGLPVVAADAGGHRETLAGLDPAALYAALDPSAAAASLRALAGATGRREAYGLAAARAQRARFTPDAQYHATDAVYRAALAGRDDA
ncbi:MAG: hypothetical protein K0S43_82 [Cellulosimicrobium sp.]|nr:hypothetical protein [Cellulosimicrobium sp.]